MAKKRIVIKDVAMEANVSNQTVSRVINNRPYVAPETRKLVQETIERLGYQPNLIAQSLRKGGSFTLGVVVKNLEFYGFSRLVSEIEKLANLRDYSLALSLVDKPEAVYASEHLSDIEAQGVDGIFWIVPYLGENIDVLRQAFDDTLVPVVCFDLQPHSEISVVSYDNYFGAKMVTQHLIEQGYRRIGIITGPPMSWITQQRFQGWKDTLRKEGIPINPTWIAEGDWKAASGYRCMTELLENNPDLEAVFAGSDAMALGSMKALANAGKRVPDDVALVGWDNLPETPFYPSALTTIDPVHKDWAYFGMEEMVRRIEAENEPGKRQTRTKYFEPKLVVRESSQR